MDYLKKRGFCIEMKQEKYELTITANNVVSTDERFTMDNLGLGDGYKPLDVYFMKADGEMILEIIVRVSEEILIRRCLEWYFKFLSSKLYRYRDWREQFPVCQYRPKMK